MTVTISLTPEVETMLRQAAIAAGKDVSTLVREALEEKLVSSNGAKPRDAKPYDQWLTEFKSWMKDVAARSGTYPPGFVLDDSRESIYEGRGE
jgi:hypothetical protein